MRLVALLIREPVMEAGVRHLLERDGDLSLLTFSGGSPPEVCAEIARVMPGIIIVDWDFPCFEVLNGLAERGVLRSIRIVRVYASANHIAWCDVQTDRLETASGLVELVQATPELEPPMPVTADDAPAMAP